MPSWIVHLATATKVSERLNIDKNIDNFLIGNLIPDAERHVIKDFSVYVPYRISHFSQFIKIDGKIEELPNIDKFMKKYKDKLSNPIVLGYLTHLLTDYFWNRTTYHRYTVRDKDGNAIGFKLNDGTEVICSIEERSSLKHGDFALFENYVITKNEYIIPKFQSNTMESLKDIEEIGFVKSDVDKILKYINLKSKEVKKEGKYHIFTKEQMLKDYEESINFIVSFLNKWGI